MLNILKTSPINVIRQRSPKEKSRLNRRSCVKNESPNSNFGGNVIDGIKPPCASSSPRKSGRTVHQAP